MSNILKIQDLYDSYNDSHFGYLGINLDTKEIGLYSDDQRKNMGGLVYNLNYNDKNFEKEFFHNGEYKRIRIESLSKKGQIITIGVLKKQIEYLKKHSYPINEFEKILKSLEFEFNDNRSNQKLLYNPLANSMLINNMHSLLIDNINKEELEYCLSSLLFGFGELNASSIKIDENNRSVILKVGFYEEVIPIEEINKCENGDNFIVLSKNLRESKKGHGLELIFNDLECREIEPNYKSVISSTYGPLLDFITEGKLRSARYEDGILKFHHIMGEIIPDINLSMELFDFIENGNLEEEVYKLLNIYIKGYIESKNLEGKELLDFIECCKKYNASICLEDLQKNNKLTKKI